MKLVLQIAAGILLAWCVTEALEYATARVAINAAIADFETTTIPSMERTAAAELTRATAAATNAMNQHGHEQRVRDNHRRAEDAQRRADAATARAMATETAAAADAAFDKVYKQRPECDRPPSWEAMVRCGDERVKARKEFEAQRQSLQPAP